jgi:hypothetical protein
MSASPETLLADEVWVALALLHRRYPDRDSFSAKEVMDTARRERAHPDAPHSARYRMLMKIKGGSYRLIRRGDKSANLKGRTAPNREDLPARYHALLDWYEHQYCRRTREPGDNDDPVLQMWCVGEERRGDEAGDAFPARRRATSDEYHA